jgi:hypothetical protein
VNVPLGGLPIGKAMQAVTTARTTGNPEIG